MICLQNGLSVTLNSVHSLSFSLLLNIERKCCCVEKKREQLQDFLTTLLDIVPEHVSHITYTQSQPHELCHYREFGDQLAYNLDTAVDMTVAAGYMEAAIADDWAIWGRSYFIQSTRLSLLTNAWELAFCCSVTLLHLCCVIWNVIVICLLNFGTVYKFIKTCTSAAASHLARHFFQPHFCS